MKGHSSGVPRHRVSVVVARRAHLIHKQRWALVSFLPNLQETQQLQTAELEATIAAMEQQCRSQETALRRTQNLNEEV